MTLEDLKAKYGIGNKPLVPVAVGQYVVHVEFTWLGSGVVTAIHGSEIEVEWRLTGKRRSQIRDDLRVVAVIPPILH